MGKRGRIHGSTLRARPLEEKAIAMRLVEQQVLPLVEAGELRVPVAATFPLDEAERPTTGSPRAASSARSSCWRRPAAADVCPIGICPMGTARTPSIVV